MDEAPSQQSISVTSLAEGGVLVKFAAAVQVTDTVHLCERLRELPLTGGVQIAWDEAEHVDTSCLQLLIALGKELGKSGQTLVVCRDNGNIRHHLELAGLSERFPLRVPPAQEVV